MNCSFLSLTILTLGLIVSSNFSGLVKFSDDGAYAQDKPKLSQCLESKNNEQYADAIKCFNDFIHRSQNPQNQEELSSLSSAYYNLADTYYLDGQYINSYISSDRISEDTDPYRQALSYLLLANNQFILGEYEHAINSLTKVSDLTKPNPKREKIANLKQDEVMTVLLLQGNIYTAKAKILSLDREKDVKLWAEKVAKSSYQAARLAILQKFIGLADQPKQEKSPYPNRIYCKPLEYDQNEIPKSSDSSIEEPFISLAQKGELDLNDNDKISFKKNAKIGDLFKLLEAIVYLSKNETYQSEFNNQFFEDKKVIQGSYINDLKCYVDLISSADNFPVQNSSQDQRSRALFYNYLGEAYEELAQNNISSEENYAKAKDSYDKSLVLSGEKYEYIKVLSLKNLANLYKKNGKNQDAVSSYERIVRSLEKTGNNILNPSLIQKQFIEENKLDVYKNMIGLLWDDSSKSENIFQYIEGSRINSERNKEVKSDCSWLLKNSYKGKAGKIAIKEILNCLPKNTTLIEYFVAKDDRVYAVVINKQNEGDKYTIELPTPKNNLGMEKELTSQIEQFYQYDLTAGVRACQQSDQKDEQLCQPQSLKKLYDILIKPIKDQIKTENLIIVPHRILHNLPFAALYDSQNKQYLIEKYAISILPSIYSLATISPSKNPVEDKNNISVVALANPTFDLLNSQIEVQTIKELKSRTNPYKSLYNLYKPLYGKNATLGNLNVELNRINPAPSIRHLSTHNKFDRQNPLNTFLLLNVLNGDKNLQTTLIDKLFNIGKVNLVVLSACETNVGEITKGDAVFNLTNSFLDQGVSSVVSSLWNVDDKATSNLMENFYTELANPGTTKAQALQNAQVKLLKNNQYRHPYYWGAFVLTGDSSPLIEK